MNNWKSIILISSSLLVLSNSCKKDKINDFGNGQIKVSVAGIEDYIDVNMNPNNVANNKSNINKSTKIVSYEDFDAITSINVANPVNNSNDTSIRLKASNRAKSPLNDTIRYRLIFIDQTDQSIAINKVVKVGTIPDSIHLITGRTYKWIAYSINRATVPDIDANKIIQKNNLTNKDFIFTSDEITPSKGDNLINILFKRYTTKYEVNIDTRGVFGIINNNTQVSLANTSNVDLFTTADFNIIDETFSNPTPIHFSGAQMSPITTNNAQKKATFYSTSTATSNANSLVLKFAPLNLKMDDGRERNFPTNNIALQHPTLERTPSTTRGRRYTINAQLIESAIVVDGDPSRTQWARSNLWYSRGNAAGEYRFRVSPHYRDFTKNTGVRKYYTDKNDLWPFNALTPDSPSGNNDPCSMVYPNGLWTTPSVDQFENLERITPIGRYLIDRNDSEYDILGLNLLLVEIKLFSGKYLEYFIRYKKAGESNDTYNTPFRAGDLNSTNDDLFFSGTGYMTDGENPVERPLLQVPVSVSANPIGDNILGISALSSFSGSGLYWTNNQSSTSLSSYFRFHYNHVFVVGLDALNILSLNVLNVGTHNVDVLPSLLRSNKLNIRCVRNPAYTATL